MSTAPEALPDLDEARPLILDGLAWLAKVAKFTATTADDAAIEAAVGIVNSPLFGMAWRLIDRRLSGVPQAPDVSEDLAELQAAVPAGISIAAVLACIEFAMQAIAWWRQRRSQPAPTPTPAPTV